MRQVKVEAAAALARFEMSLLAGGDSRRRSMGDNDGWRTVGAACNGQRSVVSREPSETAAAAGGVAAAGGA